MNRQKYQFIYLIIANFSILFVGWGLFPLLPVHAGNFNATASQVGIYLALTYLSITVGTLVPGLLHGRISRRLLLVVAGSLGSSALFLLGQATAFWQVVILTGSVWFSGGVGLATVSVLIGLHAGAGNRGKTFSLLALTTPLAAISSGLIVGRLVEWLGYPAMFALMAVEYAIWPLLSFFVIRDVQTKSQQVSKASGAGAVGNTTAFSLLLGAVLLAALTISINRIGLSLSMRAEDYSPAAISSTNVIGGLLTLPLVLGFGWLSDKLGRRSFIALGYLLAAAGGITLALAGGLWHYWLAAGSTLVARSISESLGRALATELLPAEMLARRMPWLDSMGWLAGVLGFAGSGYLLELIGQTSLFVLASLLSLVASGLIVMIHCSCQEGSLLELHHLKRSTQDAMQVNCNPS